MDIKLDKKSLKALSNDTRVSIVKLLGKRRYTQSEISEILGLSVPTVKEHLAALVKADLIQKNEEGRKWKYYSLTKKGKGVLNPEDTKILLLLVMTVLSAAGGIWMYIKSIPQKIMRTMPVFKDAVEKEIIAPGAGGPASVSTTTGTSELLEIATNETVKTQVGQETIIEAVKQPEIFLKLCWVFAFVAIILLIWIVIKIKERKKHKELLGKNLTKK